MKKKIALADGERLSSTWITVEAHAQARIETLHLMNEGDQDEVTTAKIRGQIKELRVLLAFGKVPPHYDTAQQTPDSAMGL